MVGRRLSLDITFDDAISYITSVKEALHDDEPAKYEEFIKVLKDYIARRVNDDTAITKVEELVKEHRKLLLGFSVFVPAEVKGNIPHEVKRTIPPKAKATITPKAKITITPKAEPTILPKAESTIPPETKRTIPLKAMRTITPEAKITIHPKAEATIPPETRITFPLKAKAAITREDKITIHHKAEATIPPKAKPNYEPDSVDFMKKLKTRFQKIDTHVVESFRKIMKTFQEGKMLEKEVHKEVVDLLYYHEDLIQDFFQIASPKVIQWRQYLC